MDEALLQTLETYYDSAPRASADPEEVLAEGSQDHALPRRVGEDLTPRTAVLTPDHPDLPLVVGAVHAGFSSSDDVEPRDASRQRQPMKHGLLAVVGAYDEEGSVVGGGSHGPRGGTTELTGIAVVPHARRRGVGAAITAALVADARERGVATVFLSAQDDTVARVYEHAGFVRVGTACIAEEESS